MSRPGSIRTRALVLAVAVASAFVIAACGDDDDTSTTATPAQTTESTDTTDGGGTDVSQLRDQFNQQLLQVLTAQENLTDSQADCAINELESSITDEDIQNAVSAAASGNGVPQDILDAAFDAGQKCADE